MLYFISYFFLFLLCINDEQDEYFRIAFKKLSHERGHRENNGAVDESNLLVMALVSFLMQARQCLQGSKLWRWWLSSNVRLVKSLRKEKLGL